MEDENNNKNTEIDSTKISEEQVKKPSCCDVKPRKESKGFWSGLIYGLVPHTGCIAFIIFTIFGVTAATAFFRPLLLSRYFFYGLILLSFVFATISAVIYLKRCNLLSLEGIKRKKGYLSILYGTSIGINLLLFMVIFPIAANMTSASPTGAVVAGSSDITLKVDIPCPGHAPLITEDLRKINGVSSVKFRFPNYFDVTYDSGTTNQNEIMGLEVFDIYPAKKISGEEVQKTQAQAPTGCSSCGGCSGACGGTCGGY